MKSVLLLGILVLTHGVLAQELTAPNSAATASVLNLEMQQLITRIDTLEGPSKHCDSSFRSRSKTMAVLEQRTMALAQITQFISNNQLVLQQLKTEHPEKFQEVFEPLVQRLRYMISATK